MAVIALGVAATVGAAGPMALTRDGDLYTAAVHDNQVVVTVRLADGTVSELTIPQSEAAVKGSLQVGVDETHGALYVMWQKRSDMGARIRLAGLVDGTWLGPYTVAGHFDGTAARHPQMMVYRASSTLVDEPDGAEEPVITVLRQTYLLVAWWSQVDETDPGIARYKTIPISDDGVPRTHEEEPIDLVDLLPYGIACFDLAPGENLTHPKLFRDPQSGNIHIFAADLSNCLFQILELRPEVIEDIHKRRRQIIILREASMIALRPDLPLSRSKLEVGKGLKIIMHWDDEADNVLHFLELDQQGISEPKSVPLGDDLNHEQAVELIRDLTN
jgi:hypothetical protein